MVGYQPLRRRKYGLSQTWYSICSAHQGHRLGCSNCEVGQWIYDWRHAVGNVIFKRSPRFWRWLHRKHKLQFSRLPPIRMWFK